MEQCAFAILVTRAQDRWSEDIAETGIATISSVFLDFNLQCLSPPVDSALPASVFSRTSLPRTDEPWLQKSGKI